MAREHWTDAEELLLASTVASIADHCETREECLELLDAFANVTGRSRRAVMMKADRQIFGRYADDKRRERTNNKPYWQMRTREYAFKSGQPWEEWEDEFVMTNVEPLKNMAYMLGRTYRSVEDRRKRLRKQGLTWC